MRLITPRIASILFLLLCPLSLFAASCDDLARLDIANVRVTATDDNASGSLEQRVGPALSLPAHCRVAAVLTPSTDSHIEMELWLPDQWNGKFLAVGNGGWAGSISYGAMARGLQAGYAVASTDTGHKGGRADFAVGHPEKLVDFGWRAMHEMTTHSKNLVAAYYETAPHLSYYQGCSTGGRQGMIEAQRFPADFDGLIIGAPVYDMVTMNTVQLHHLKTLLENRESALSPEKVAMLHRAVMAACEANDGVEDGFLNNPLACHFEAGSLACPADGSAFPGNVCLTTAELEAVQTAYEGIFASDGSLIYPGHAKGFELGWRIPPEGSEPMALVSDATRFLVHEDPQWDWREFDLQRDLALIQEKAGYIEALETDLSEFRDQGGKLLFYHGWNDPGPSPLHTIEYIEDVQATMGVAGQGTTQDDWLRLFMMPGMGHCAGGIGPDQADFLGALEAWVEEDVAPKAITAARIREGRVDMTRPLCAYPATATWDGKGNPDDASSFSCQSE